MKRWGFWLIGAATLFGLAAVAAGWFLRNDAYLSGLLVQIGSSFALIIPLVLLGKMLEQRIEQAERHTRGLSEGIAELGSRVSETVGRLEQISGAVEQSLVRSQEAQQVRLDRAEAAPGQPDLRSLLAEAAASGAIGAAGLRTRMRPDSGLRLRFAAAADGNVAVLLETAGGAAVPGPDRGPTRVLWGPAETAVEFVARLTGALRVARVRDPGGAPDGSYVLGRLVAGLRTALDRVATGDVRSWGALIEPVGGPWLLTENGLWHTGRRFGILRERLVDSEEDWPQYLSRYDWFDPAEFREVCATAIPYFEAAPPRPPAPRRRPAPETAPGPG
jgi:hypothetical protein